MTSPIRLRHWLRALGSLSALFSVSSLGWAQLQQQQQAGVVVDANGVLSMAYYDDLGGQLTRQRMVAAKAALDPDISRKSKLRMVSLTRLEKAVVDGHNLTDEMRYLAGLTRIQYVFFYPDSGDVVLAGPAEGWYTDLSGRVVGLSSGQPVLELQDLVVALRAYRPGGDAKRSIGCSIDPTKEGLSRYQQFLKSLPRGFAAEEIDARAPAIAQGIRESMGMQSVRFMGVPATTHFAQVMLEADYRMKLIGIGDPSHDFSRGKLALKSFVQIADAAAISGKAMHRWWFMPEYACVRLSEDRLAMELVGQGVKLVGEDEVVAADGQRTGTGSIGGASHKFTLGFTKKYAQLAQVVPVYAQLRNLIDMAIVAAHIQKQDYYEKAGWDLPIFGDEQQFPVESYQTPTQVEPAVTAFMKNGRLVTPVGGGVRIDAELALVSTNLLPDEDSAVEKAHSQTQLDHLEDGQWWWD
ncbi:MAG TPA: DUF1598 domain-containing protein [Pirellulales bacterium]|nr:DUF1598 domain-containing protein [Pirellulales bacterium]